MDIDLSVRVEIKTARRGIISDVIALVVGELSGLNGFEYFADYVVCCYAVGLAFK